MLTQFHKQVESASQLAPKLFKGCPAEEMQQTLDMLGLEGVLLPERLKLDILMRRVGRLMSEKKYVEVLDVLSPWAASVFHHNTPNLLGLTDDPSKRVVLFRKHFLVDVTMKLMIREQPEAESGSAQQTGLEHPRQS